MEDLELRHARAASVLLEPGLLNKERAVELAGRRHPAVPLAEQPHEKRAGTVDLGEADRQHLALLGLRLGNSPAEIDVHKLDLPLATPPPEVRKHLSHEQIPLPREIPERRADEDAYGAAVSHCDLRRKRLRSRAGRSPAVVAIEGGCSRKWGEYNRRR